ncbi:VWA domain-containing protein [candidate division KSB1 bacterium]|nr:VWA domain-containing protein [candidate division KSB1 bacterium]
MIRNILINLLVAIFAVSSNLSADGLLRSNEEAYPEDFLRHRLTKIDVHIRGQFAETTVYQEFVNEWYQSTDAVYAFPLAPDARATNFFYWRNDTCFKAILKVKEQAVNPGTGEGGVAALVNEYIGRNGIKVALQDIAPNSIQRTQLNFVSRCDYFQDKMAYTFPLDTQDFLKYPIDLLDVTIHLHANAAITSAELVSHPGEWRIVKQERDYIRLEMKKSKTYLTRNLKFEYIVPNDALDLDFYSVANDSVPGHFVLTVKPDETIDETNVLNKRLIFLLDVSSHMYGDKLDLSKQAVAWCLDLLQPDDYFNIVTFSYSVNSWKTVPVQATALNIQNAKNYLKGASTEWGSDMESALIHCLQQFQDDLLCNSILAFASGFTPLDPRIVESFNQFKAGIFTIGLGDDVDRAKLETVSLLNYGFTTYFDEGDNLYNGIIRVFTQINRPVLKDTRMEFGRSDLHDLFPIKVPTIYQGSRFFMTGRYNASGQSVLSIAGYAVDGVQSLDFNLDFSDSPDSNKFAESFWAKEKIDALEREIAIYGEDETLKQELIRVSLAYNIRCKYTAYVADYSPEHTDVDDSPALALVPQSYIIGNYPNPFNPSTTIQFFLAADAAKIHGKFIRIYNILGQLVAVIDISHLGPGLHSRQFHAFDFAGRQLGSGTYLCQLVVGEIVSTVRMSLVR